MAHYLPIWPRMLVPLLTPLLLLVVTSAPELGIRSSIQTVSPAHAWHKFSPTPFLRSLRRLDVDERYCVDPGSASWSTASGPINYALLPEYPIDRGGTARWHTTGNNHVFMVADKGDVCGGPRSYWVDNPGSIKIRYHIREDSGVPSLCNGYTSTGTLSGRALPFGCAIQDSNSYRYSVCLPDWANCDPYASTFIGNAYEYFDVYLGRNRICCTSDTRDHDLNIQHVNHETGHVLSLSDPPLGNCAYQGSQ